MRKLATIRTIEEIKSIPDADKICAYRVDGWWVVDSINKYNLGDKVIYCEIDSWIPTEIAPFLSKDSEPKEYKNVKGERLKTIKLRGQISQGLLMPLTILEGKEILDDDVTDILGILKWEAPTNPQLAGQVKGNFPSFIKKTDQERLQNLKSYFERYKDKEFEVTVKVDGSSMTVFHNNGETGVCSRNMNLKESEGNSYWRMAKEYQLLEKLTNYGKNIALQMELYGEGIQKNPEKIKGLDIAIFDVYDIDNGVYFNSDERNIILSDLGLLEKQIKILGHFKMPANIEEALIMAEGESLSVNTKREGIVFKGHGISFKVISNSYLLKNSDI